MLRCPVCGEFFTTLGSLKLHYRRHYDLYLLFTSKRCVVCGRLFIGRRSLMRHYAAMASSDDDHAVFLILERRGGMARVPKRVRERALRRLRELARVGRERS